MIMRYLSAFRSIMSASLLFGVLVLGMSAGIPDAMAQQTQAAFSEGHAICGAMDLRSNTLLAPCGFAKAKYLRKAVGECPRGSFFDLGTWSCYSCPNGFNRTGFAVDTAQACSKQISSQYARANRVGGQQSCPQGSFHDPRNGGECWSCPAGFGRTLSAVNAWDACGKFGATARRAEFIDRVCAEGAFPDPNGSCYTCPEGYRRTAAAVTASNACFRNEQLEPAEKVTALTCKAGEIFDFIDGGTCWECPDQSVRSTLGIKSSQACEFTTMRWESAVRTPSGLFDLPGAYEIAAELITDRAAIDASITKFITESKLSGSKADEFKTGAWEVVMKTPEASPILKAAMYDHLYNVIKRGPKTKAERDLVGYLAVYVQQSRKLVASEMDQMWRSWTEGINAQTAARGHNMVNAYNTGIKPPDMRTPLENVMLLGPSAGFVLTFIGATVAEAASPAIAEATAKMAIAILPYRFRDAAQVGAAASTAGVGAAAGPLMVLTVTSIIASFATDIALEQNKQEAIVTDALAVAKRPVDLQRLLKTDDGRTEVAGNWALMTQEATKPIASKWNALLPQTKATSDSPLSVVLEGNKVIVTGSIGPTPVLDAGWMKVDGSATDIAVSTDGTAYAIGVTKVPGGFEIYKRPASARKWTKLMGGAVRVAVMDNQVWVINSAGKIYAQFGTKWRLIQGPAAQDIGASANGVWVIATDGSIHRRDGNGWAQVTGNAHRIDIDRDGRPWVVNDQGGIYVHDNTKKWVKLEGSAQDIAVDVPGKAQIVGPDGRVYAYNEAKRNWDTVSKDTDTKGIGAGNGQVWRLTIGNDIYRLN